MAISLLPKPQMAGRGSALSPIIFLVFINDLLSFTKITNHSYLILFPYEYSGSRPEIQRFRRFVSVRLSFWNPTSI